MKLSEAIVNKALSDANDRLFKARETERKRQIAEKKMQELIPFLDIPFRDVGFFGIVGEIEGYRLVIESGWTDGNIIIETQSNYDGWTVRRADKVFQSSKVENILEYIALLMSDYQIERLQKLGYLI